MAINNEDIRREEETDRKVSVKKDLNRVAHGDVKGVLHDDMEELKADIKSVDDKTEKAFDRDDR